MRIFLTALMFVLFSCASSKAQNNDVYFGYTMQAIKSFEKKEYKKAAGLYTKAFRANSWKAYEDDRLNAARAWAMAGNLDSAFSQLSKLVKLYEFENYDKLDKDSALATARKDVRWREIREQVMLNILKEEAGVNSSLALLLDSVYRDHQRYRFEAVIIKNRYGNESEQNKDIWKTIHSKDSLNLSIVEGILDKYGWLGKDVVGVNGNSTLAMIILHADLDVQLKYLPMMREAHANGKADAADLAALEDKVALRQGRKQLYGTNLVSFDGKKYYISPMEDPQNVDKRRASLGLEKMNKYLVNFGMRWDIEKYKKELSLLEGKNLKY
jgi:hypothetical protein